MNEYSMGSLALGLLVGGVAIWAVTQNRRPMHRTMKRLAGGAERAMNDLDKMICRCTH